MLVLSRKKNEAIVIGGAIEIGVVNVTKATVRVRLSAPRSMQVVRGLVKKELGAELIGEEINEPEGAKRRLKRILFRRDVGIDDPRRSLSVLCFTSSCFASRLACYNLMP